MEDERCVGVGGFWKVRGLYVKFMGRSTSVGGLCKHYICRAASLQIVLNTQKSFLKSSYPKKYLPNFPTPQTLHKWMSLGTCALKVSGVPDAIAAGRYPWQPWNTGTTQMSAH